MYLTNAHNSIQLLNHSHNTTNYQGFKKTATLTLTNLMTQNSIMITIPFNTDLHKCINQEITQAEVTTAYQ